MRLYTKEQLAELKRKVEVIKQKIKSVEDEQQCELCVYICKSTAFRDIKYYCARPKSFFNHVIDPSPEFSSKDMLKMFNDCEWFEKKEEQNG